MDLWWKFVTAVNSTPQEYYSWLILGTLLLLRLTFSIVVRLESGRWDSWSILFCLMAVAIAFLMPVWAQQLWIVAFMLWGPFVIVADIAVLLWLIPALREPVWKIWPVAVLGVLLYAIVDVLLLP